MLACCHFRFCDSLHGLITDVSSRTRRLFTGTSQRAGKAKAITAIARKLALLVYRALSGALVYPDPGATAYQQLHRTLELKSLRRRARLLGFQLGRSNYRRGYQCCCFVEEYRNQQSFFADLRLLGDCQ
jgi:hypothetical protein